MCSFNRVKGQLGLRLSVQVATWRSVCHIQKGPIYRQGGRKLEPWHRCIVPKAPQSCVEPVCFSAPGHTICAFFCPDV